LDDAQQSQVVAAADRRYVFLILIESDALAAADSGWIVAVLIESDFARSVRRSHIVEKRVLL